MKKSLYILPLALVIILSIYVYNNKSNIVEVNTYMNKDTVNDYNNIIIKKGNEENKVIALTFDDGPDEVFTPQILDVLKKHDVKATFFVVGQKVTYNPEIVKRQNEEGHELGNHTFSHINVSKSGYDNIKKEISDTQEAIKKVIGKEPQNFRPPYRAISKNMCSIIKNKDMNIILWSDLDPRDWSNPGVNYICNTILQKTKNGTIILLHDYNKIRNAKSQTIKALDIFIPKLKEQGYKFVTVSELIEELDSEKEAKN